MTDERDREPSSPRDEAWLWDRSGAPDPLGARLEQALAPLRLDAPLGPLPERAGPRRRAPAWPVAAGAALALAAGAALWLGAGRAVEGPGGAARASRGAAASVASEVAAALAPCRAEPTPGAEELRYEVLEGGAPRCGGLPASSRGYVARGGWLETPPGVRVRILLTPYGHVDLAPGSRLRVLAAEPAEQRLELDHGKLSALVTAPPRLFLVRTRLATAIDLGCAYDLEIAEDGTGTLRVTSGAVELAPPADAKGALPVHVPRGAEAAIGAGGPGTPVWSARAPSVRDALRAWDRDPRDVAALDHAVRALGEQDTLSLAHLLARAPRDRRASILDKLPPTVEQAAGRQALLDATPAALLAARDALAARWRTPGEPAGGAPPLPPKAPGTGPR